MYIPPLYKNENENEINSFIEQNGFATLISHAAGKLLATHLPLMFSKDRKSLYGHFAKANEQWKHIAENEEVLAIFNGPHAYISSSWYNHENVPTWNYIAVHVYGKPRIITGEELIASLRELTDKYETSSANPVSVTTMTPAYFEKELRGLVGFAIKVDRIEAAYKLSQNRDKINHENIVVELRKRNDAADMAIADEMIKHQPAKFKNHE
ncbi:MAG TPA: FMN-binding negative transcriptional regulator [Chryseosolibacter sp.]|nr:FMN-binding negative transcriptional regulator [Chryseosolibacter sp.]